MVVRTYLKAALSISIFLAAVGPAAASPPTQAANPNPADGAIDVSVEANLTWVRGDGADEDEVYFGTDPCALYKVAHIIVLPMNPPFYNPGDPNLVASTTYYWRVDEVNDTDIITGDLWSFTTVGGEAQCAYPEDGAVIPGDIVSGNIVTELIFIPGPTAVEHTGYFSEDYSKVATRHADANLGPPPYAQWEDYKYTFFAGWPGVPPADETLVRGTRYYWTVDETDAQGNTFPGDIWEFAVQGLYALEPIPPNEAVDVETDVLLSWMSGLYVCCHGVYIGTSRDDVNNADWTDTTGIYKGYTWEPFYQCSNLAFNTKYYWRVDEVSPRSCTPPRCAGPYYKGDVWSFTTEANRIFVDIDANGANNGTSWENAYNFLQDALIEAESAVKPVEISVAEGIYTPDSNLADPNGSGDRAATLRLINGVTIKGGYAGYGHPNPDARDIELYETILSGDLDSNDVDVNNPADLLDEPTRGENSYHVVIASGTDVNAVLDGFTISGGNAEGANYGGGIYNNNGSPTISNCIFSENSAGWGGGGMYNNSESHPTVTNCTFTLNASFSGSGMLTRDFGKPTLFNCTFIRNSAFGFWSFGGAIYGGYGQIINCTFTGNSADYYGGGLSDCGGLISNCTISGNSAGENGGGFSYTEANPGTLINCIISDNTSGDDGGGIYFRPPTIPLPLGALSESPYSSFPQIVITNCTVGGNVTGGDGGGIYVAYGESLLTNCILWGNTPDQIYGSKTMVTYSVVQGDCVGLGNIDADPCFVDVAGGDFRLSSDSPCIDTGDNNAPNLPPTDLDVHPRIIDGDCNGSEVVDMGAYEFNYAYMGDFDYNCRVNFADLSIFGLAWTSQPGDFNWDFACNINIPADNVVDRLDLAVFADNWLAGK